MFINKNKINKNIIIKINRIQKIKNKIIEK